MNEMTPKRPGRIWDRKVIMTMAAALVIAVLVVVAVLSLLGPTMCGDSGLMSNIVQRL